MKVLQKKKEADPVIFLFKNLGLLKNDRLRILTVNESKLASGNASNPHCFGFASEY